MPKLESAGLEYFQNLHRLQSLGLTPSLLGPPTPSVLPPPYHHYHAPPTPPRSAFFEVAGNGAGPTSEGLGLSLQPQLLSLTSQAEAAPSTYRLVSVPEQPPATSSFSAAPVQLQTVDTPNGPCYLIVGDRGPPAAPAPPKYQQATFIPIGLPAQPAPAAAAVQPIDPPKPPSDSPHRGKRKACHNEVEKRRRDKINNWIEALNKLLPEEAVEEAGGPKGGGGQGPSKGVVLAKAVEFVGQLKATNRELVAENARLREQMAALLPAQPSPPKRARTGEEEATPTVAEGDEKLIVS